MKGARFAARLLSRPCSSGVASVGLSTELVETTLARNLRIGTDVSTQAASASQLNLTRGMAYRNKVTIEYIKLKEPENDDYATRDPTNYAQLLGAISISRHLDRTTYLYETFKDKFDTIHYVTALTKLPGLVHYRGADLVMRDGVQWSEGVKPFWQKPNAQPRKHLLPKAQGLLSKLEEQFPPHLNNLFPRQTANLIWAYGQLKRKQVVAACPFLGDFLLSLRRDNFLALDKHATGADYAQIVKGLANLQTAGSPADEDTRALIEDFVDQLTQEMLLRRGHARLLDAREAQSILWGLGKLNRRKNTAIIDVLCDVVLAGVNSLTPTALAGAFSALAKLGHSSRTDVFEAMAKGYHLQTTLMSPQDVSLTVCACADLGFRDDNLLKICGLKAADMLGEFSNASLAWLMAGFGRLGYNHEAFFSAVNKSVLAEPVVEVEPGFAWRVLSAYAGSGRKDSESLKVCGRITEAFLAKLDKANAFECLRVLDLAQDLGLVQAGFCTEEQVESVREAHTWLIGKNAADSPSS